MNDEIPSRPPLNLEVATTGDGRDITRPWIMPLLPTSDRIVQQRGGGDLAIYEQVLSDSKVGSAFQQRVNAVVRCEWAVDPASDRRADKKAAEFVRQQLQRVGWDNVTRKMLFGVFYGYAVAETMYGLDGGQVVWDAIKVRNRRRFRFTPKGELRLLTPTNQLEGEVLPPAKFWHFATGADHDDEPYGLGLGHWCYWPVLFKRNGIRFWLTFVEKFAAPTAVGEFDVGATDADRQKLLSAVQAIQTDSGIIIPKGMEIRLLEATRGGTVDYKTLHDTMNETIAEAVLGQTLTSSVGEHGGNRALGDVHFDVRQDLVKSDADLVCESLNLSAVKWLTQWNFDGADPPRVYRVVEQPEDLEKRAQRDKSVSDLGFKPSLSYVLDTYGGEWTEKQTPPPKPGDPAPAPTPADFAAGNGGYVPPDLRALDALLDDIEAGNALQAQAEQLLAPLIAAAQQPADFTARLAQLYPALDDRALQDTMDRLLFAAEVQGALYADTR